MANFPTITVEVAFTSGPLAASPTWTDISADVQQISIQSPSRSSQQPGIGQFSAGTLTVKLNDKQRKYDPTNAASPYAPNVIPRRQIRVHASINGVYSAYLWYGFIETWPPERIGLNNAQVTVTASDALAYLANIDLEDELLGEELAHERITDVLDLVGWPAALRNIDTTGDQAPIAEEESFSGSAGNHLQAVADTELGRLFADRNGIIVFQSHTTIRDASAGTSFVYGFGDNTGVGELPYTHITNTYGIDDVANHAVVNLADWDPGEHDDATSQTTYGKISLTVDTLLADPADADTMAEIIVWRYKNPRLRSPSIDIKGATLPTLIDDLWGALFNINVGTRLRVRQRHPAGGTVNDQYPFVEGFSHEISNRQWESTLTLGAPDPVTDWFIVEDNTYGLLDSGPGVLSY